MDEEDDDQTRVVAHGTPSPTDDHQDDQTRVVQRKSPAPDHDDDETRVVSHSALGAEADEDDVTRVVTREHSNGERSDNGNSGNESDDDNTRVVTREAKKHSLTLPASGRRRGISMPPAMEDFAPDVEVGRGAGAVEAYPAREIPEPPPDPTPTEEGPEATRASAPSMPSVLRRSRLAAKVALSVFIASCVLAVAGIIVAVIVVL